MELVTEIRKYISAKLLYLDEGFEYDNDTSFIDEGLIDSTGVMELVMYVQSTYNLTVEPHEVTPDNFDSVNKLVGFIQRKQHVQAAADSDHASSGRVTDQQFVAGR
jgi:acyl carrier protein